MAVSFSDQIGSRLALAMTLVLCAAPAFAQGFFSLAVVPPTITACANNVAFAKIRLQAGGGFTDAVFLSAPPVGPLYRVNGIFPNPITPVGVNPTFADMSVYFFPTAAGPYFIPITGRQLPFGSTQTAVARFTVTPSLVGVILQAFTPQANQTDIGLRPRFAWTQFPGVTFGADVDDDLILPKLETKTTPENDIRFDTTLEPNSTYNFTVRAVNSCSQTNLLMVSATTAQACFFVDQAIPDNGTLVSTVGIAGNIAENLRLTLGIDHPRAGDLKVTLSRLDRSAVVLDRPGFPSTSTGCNKANIETVLRDGESLNNETQCEPFGPALAGPLVPTQPMSTFEGVPATGDWVLTVQDMAPQQSGRLVEWCLSSGNAPDDQPFVEFNDDVLQNGFELTQ